MDGGLDPRDTDSVNVIHGAQDHYCEGCDAGGLQNIRHRCLVPSISEVSHPANYK